MQAFHWVKAKLVDFWLEVAMLILIVGFVANCFDWQIGTDLNLAAAFGLNGWQWIYILASVAILGIFIYFVFSSNDLPGAQTEKKLKDLLALSTSAPAQNPRRFNSPRTLGTASTGRHVATASSDPFR